MKYKIIKEKKDILCLYCNRNLLNKKMITKNGCWWCDLEYQYNKRIYNEKENYC